MALNLKGETAPELVGFVQSIQSSMHRVRLAQADVIDVCGTGGDGIGTFNVSTCVAFVVAGAGVPVAKHGNRAVSSRSGSSDVLTELGVVSCESEFEVQSCMNEFHLSFMFAPAFHPTLKAVASLRKSLGVRTVFNLLGPLLNPAQVSRQLLGVFHPKYLQPMAQALKELGVKEALVVCGEGGLDEVSLTGSTQVVHLRDGQVREFTIEASSFGFTGAKHADLMGGDAKQNAQILRAILAGERGPKRDLVVLNAAAALFVGGKVSDLVQGVELAQHSLDSGEAQKKLEQMQLRQFKTPPTVLSQIASSVAARLDERYRDLDGLKLKEKAAGSRIPHSLKDALNKTPAVIAEIKFASPSQGEILKSSDTPVEIARQYLEAGASALSILTEVDHFSGSLEYLKDIRSAFPRAVLLMKDFIIDERQIYEARILGADVILLIVALLDIGQLKKFFKIAQSLSLNILVEVHDESEMQTAVELGADFIGVNNRDLKTLKVSLEISKRLAGLAPEHTILISESGFSTSQEMKELNQLGYKAFLIGTSLMASGQPGLKLKELVENFK